MDGVNTCCLYGGDKIENQIALLKEKKPKIVVGTPGRLLALIKKGILPSANVNMFVLDECDKILGAMGIFFIKKNKI